MLRTGARIHHPHPQNRPAVEDRRCNPSGSLFVIAWSQLSIDGINSLGVARGETVFAAALLVSAEIAEAKKVRLRLVEVLEVAALLYRVVQQPRGVAEVVVKPSQSARAEPLDREPELQHVGTARALKAANPLIQDSSGFSSVKEIRRLLRECSFEVTLVPREHHSRRERKQHALVRIPRQGARVLQSLERAWRAHGKQGARTMRAVNMEPDIP